VSDQVHRSRAGWRATVCALREDAADKRDLAAEEREIETELRYWDKPDGHDDGDNGAAL